MTDKKNKDYLYKNVAHVKGDGVKISNSYKAKKMFKSVFGIVVLLVILLGAYFGQDKILKKEATLNDGRTVQYEEELNTARIGDSILVKSEDYNILNKKVEEYKITDLPLGLVNIDNKVQKLENDEYMATNGKENKIIKKDKILGVRKKVV